MEVPKQQLMLGKMLLGSSSRTLTFLGRPRSITYSWVRSRPLLADQALAKESSVSSSSATTAFILGRLLVVANAGDCRAVLCRRGEAIHMSQDHIPIYPSERHRVEELGGYLMKFPRGSLSPLISNPELRQVLLTEDDEFLMMGCDGMWDVMSSQHAVGVVQRGLRRHDEPEQCTRDLVKEALRLTTFDNRTVIVVCFTPVEHREVLLPPHRKLRWCSQSAEALCSLKNLLDCSSR